MELQICPERYQTANRVLMIRPSCFGYHPQAATSNTFIHKPTDDQTKIAAKALDEFDALAQALQQAGVDVLIHQDTTGLPDCVFPNNWMSWHNPVGIGPVVVTYPMCDELRRAERSDEVLDLVSTNLGVNPAHLDLSALEEDGEILEGTGSLVLDRVHGVAFGCRSPRTTDRAFDAWCDETGYQGISFDALDDAGEPIYHTNVLMSVGQRVAVLCSACISDDKDRDRVLMALKMGDRQVIEIDMDQMGRFCGNILELVDGDGNPIFAMSLRAYEGFTPQQKRILHDFGAIVHVPIPTIEDVGGGSVRCMIAELGRG